MIRVIALIVLIVSASAAHADDNPSEALTVALQQCIEAVNDGSGEQPDYAACIGVGTNACQVQPGGDTTMGMVDCNSQEQRFWDDILNTAYDELQGRLDAEPLAALKAAQRIWITWRDAKCEVLLAIYSEGSIRGVVYSACTMETTAQRAVDLMDIAYQM